MKTADRAAATARSADCPIAGCPVGARFLGGRGCCSRARRICVFV